MPEPLYRLRNMGQNYDGRRVLTVDELDVERGEVVALVGPSGAGKSTLLRLLNFLELPTEGSIEYRGRLFDARNPLPLALRREVTTVFQRPLLLSRSVRDNVAYPLQLRGRNGQEKVAQALDRVGLLPLARQAARTLSGGEAQRVALARALVTEPTVLLLDEPTANLDPYNVGVIEEIVQQLNAERGTTLVLVTHNVFQARRLASRVVFLLNGNVIEVADKEQFFATPRDPRTAAFVRGDMVY